jgi:hypothetical protein
MTCPRCGNEWDVSKSPCPRCGLLVHLPGRLGARSVNTPVSPPQKPPLQSGNSPAVKLQGNTPAPTLPGMGMSNFTSPLPAPRPTRESMSPSRMPYQPSSAFSHQGQKSGDAAPSSLSFTPIPRTPLPPASMDTKSTSPSTNTQRRDVSTGKGESVGNEQLSPQSARTLPVRPQFTATDASQVSVGSTISHTPPGPSVPMPPHRLVTKPLRRGGQHLTSIRRLQPPLMDSGGQAPLTGQVQPLVPGTLLRGGRYQLQEQQERQDWLHGVYEVWWVARDAQRNAMPVMICEVMIPDSGSIVVQSTLRAATMALASVGRHPSIPTLWDAFSDQGRNFFVFEPVEGESLLARMRRTRHALPEQDVIECCLQMTEILELLNLQSPPLVHGLIRPEHIIEVRQNGQYVLTHFSIIMAGGANQFIAGLERSQLSPYLVPEIMRGSIDVRSDLYSLLATAYYAVTGSVPSPIDGVIPSARQLNPMISVQFEAILTRGLHANAAQRYQRPSELRQGLLAIRSVNGTIIPVSSAGQDLEWAGSKQSAFPEQPQAVSDSVAQLLPNMMAPALEDVEEELRVLLPRPEELPPMAKRNDMQLAFFWIAGILVCLIILVILSRWPV